MEEPIKQNNAPLPPQKKLTSVQVIGINMGVLLVVELICFAVGEQGLVGIMFFMGLQFFGCLIVTVIDRERWAGWLISAFLSLIIGFSTCVAGLSFAH